MSPWWATTAILPGLSAVLRISLPCLCVVACGVHIHGKGIHGMIPPAAFSNNLVL